MMHISAKWALLILTVVLLPSCFLAGCYTSLSEKGSVVRYTLNPEAVSGCKKLGEVETNETTSRHRPMASIQSLKNDLRNKGSQIGGNVVLAHSTTRMGCIMQGTELNANGNTALVWKCEVRQVTADVYRCNR